MSNKLQLGLIVDALTVPAWAFAMLERIVTEDYAEIKVILVDKTPVHTNEQGAKTFLYRLYDRLERRVVKFAHDPFVRKDCRPLMPAIPLVDFHSDQSLSDELEAVRNANVDILFHLGQGKLSGDILTIPRLGVWAYEHGDLRRKRGGPIGFWEVVDEHLVTGIALKRLTENVDTDVIITRSYSPTDTPLAHRNRYYHFWKAAIVFPRELKRLSALGEDKFLECVQTEINTLQFYDGESYDIPSNFEFLRRYIAYMVGYMRGKIYRLLTKEQWVLYYDLRQGISKSLGQYRQLIPPRDRLWADPYVVYKDAKYYVFIEELLFENNRGRIAVIEIDEVGNTSPVYTVLERPYHLSYPFIFSYQDKYYMLPETSGNRTIEVYEATEFPTAWQPVATLMKDLVAVDTTLYYHEDRWWMFTTIQEEIAGSLCDDLYLFFSDDPLSDNWQPHPLNPVISDARRARPAGGLFEYNGELYRPAQDDTRVYGYGVRINRIIKLSPTEYSEAEVDFLEPLWNSKVQGLHTFNYQGNMSIIDAYTRISKFR